MKLIFCSLATQPRVLNQKIAALKLKDRGFKTAADGRLIITEGNERDDEREVKKNKKVPFLHSDSEEDYGKKIMYSYIKASMQLNRNNIANEFVFRGH